MNRLILLIQCAVLSLAAVAQEKGTLAGQIIDGDFGEPMIGATVMLSERPGVGAVTGMDGRFSLQLDSGTYDIEVAFISYVTQVFEDVKIQAGKPTELNTTLQTNAAELAAVEVVAEVRRNSDIAMLMDMKNATNVTDGLSSQSFRKTGDSDLGGAIKRITGVTVQEGKYVYVRGLGDRYTKTLLNGMEIPGLDPDVNAVQMDIFPTSILENVAVYKTFSPNLPGDFTGGLVNIGTHGLPEAKTTQFGLGLTFVPSMHFNRDFILYNGGKYDWTGFDDGSRALPFPKGTNIRDEALADPRLEQVTRSFGPELSAKQKTAWPNGSFSINHGNRLERKNGPAVGYNLALNYANEHIFYENFQSNEYLKDNDPETTQLFKNVGRTGSVGKNAITWSGLLSGSYKKGNSTLSAVFLRSQGSEATAAQRLNQDFNQNQATLVEDVLTYSQRSLNTFLLEGRHRAGRVEINWANAFSYSRVYDPDFRETRISITDGDTALSTGNGAGIDRFWRDLHEFNESARMDLKIQVSETFDLKAGASGSLKWRDFEVLSYKHRRNNLNDISIDPDWFLQEENIWSADPEDENFRNGTYTIGNFQPANSYAARQQVFGGYAMVEHPVLEKLKMVYGVRLEKVDMYYTGENNTGSEVYSNERTMDELNILPSLNMVYGISDKMNLRAAATKTVARPTFREKSIAQVYDPITKRTFVGNLDLEQTQITNLDLRYEYFISPKELFSVAAFYKQFDGHIELVAFETAPDNLKPRNSGMAEVFGAELEIRKGLTGATSRHLQRLFASANVSLAHSRVDMRTVLVNNAGLTEYGLRENNLRTGEDLASYRPMAGQSPYAVNAALSYEIPEKETSISLAYNVQGEQLSIIASGRVPDVYTLPFHSLNFNAYKGFGKKMRSKLTLSLRNLLDEGVTMVYRSFQAADAVYSTYKPDLGIGLKYSYAF